MITHSTEPFNAEPTLTRLRASYLTGKDDFYIRSHGDVPVVDPDDYRLRVHGLSLSLTDLRERFATRHVIAVMQCAGNRRAELMAVQPVSGDPWAPGAIGNAEWSGVPLAKVLQAAGATAGQHVVFTAADMVRENGRAFRYAVSIPIAKAMTPEVLLAWDMNGEPLTPSHGAPLRLVVPGYAGVRSAKWVSEITVQDGPAECPIQEDDYKLLPAAGDGTGLTINDMPINAAICAPEQGAAVPAGSVAVRGYAVATAFGVSRVEVSADGGRNWRQARLEPSRSAWSWVFWEAEVDLAPGAGELVVRAWDKAGQTQPTTLAEIWNRKGYLCNAWHRVAVTAQADGPKYPNRARVQTRT